MRTYQQIAGRLVDCYLAAKRGGDPEAERLLVAIVAVELQRQRRARRRARRRRSRRS
jgi:hypothetical protein